MERYTVYVIQSVSTRKIYVGQTSDLETRLKRRNKILAYKRKGYTSVNRGPWEIIYTEEFTTRIEALHREKELKSHQGREFIKTMVAVAQR